LFLLQSNQQVFAYAENDILRHNRSICILEGDLGLTMFVSILMMIGVVTLMIFLNALYVAGEFSSVSARKSRIEQLAADGNQFAVMLLPVMKDHHRLDNYIAASQVGITLSSIVLGIYGQRTIAPLLEAPLANLPFLNSDVAAAGIAATLVLIILTGLQVVLGELVPKSLALQYPERMAMLTVLPMRWSADLILRPLIILLNGSGALLLRLMKLQHGGGHQHIHSPEEIKFLIQESHKGGLLDEEEQRLLDNALRFGHLHASDILVPRTRMIAADIHTPVDDLLKLAAQADYTRIPVYENDVDHIIGFVHLKELFQLSYRGEQTNVRSILRDVVFVHESMNIDNVWNTLNEAQCYIAIVFDEYGGTLGMVTREDLLEELFGDVQDEFDEPEIAALTRLSSTEFRVRGDVPVVVLNDRLNISLPTDSGHTIGGLILNMLGHLPQVGEHIMVSGVQLQVQAVEEKAVAVVHLMLAADHIMKDEGS
jgi:CBS domain containing-hemolysin-like protein